MIKDTVYGLSPTEFIKAALEEDIGDGDHTSLSTIDDTSTGSAIVRVKEDGVIAGIDAAKMVLECVDSTLKFEFRKTDGAHVVVGDEIIRIEGNVRSMLKAERLMLNCMQRMSGIATLTRKYVDAIVGTNSKILDTRKTTPNFRYFEKMAVRAGGGFNHRTGLYDMILIKNNHVDASGGIKKALLKAGEYIKTSGRKLSIEIETRNLEEVKEVLDTGIASRIMLDNFEPGLMRSAIEMIDNKFETEASGGINLSTVRAYAMTGVNFISVGALTHSYKSLDIHMRIQ